MKKRFVDSEKLDNVGAQLLKSASLKEAEIERLVSKPELFAAIVKEIEAEKSRLETPVWAPGSGSRLIINRQKIGVAFGVLCIVLGVLFILPYFQKQKSSPDLISENTNPSESEGSSVAVRNSEAFQKPDIESIKPPDAISKPEKIKHKMITAAKKNKPVDRSSKRISAPPKQKEILDEDFFYPLTLAADFNSEDDHRIIRVSLSRDLLAAFGLNELIVNENEVIVTDLVIGSDGTPQAYRFIKNF